MSQDNHSNKTLKHLTKQSAGPARPRADGAVNFKTAVNPAKASRCNRECLVFAGNHYFAEIYAVLEESAGAWPGQGFWSFCPQKDIKKHQIIFLKKNNQTTKQQWQPTNCVIACRSESIEAVLYSTLWKTYN